MFELICTDKNIANNRITFRFRAEARGNDTEVLDDKVVAIAMTSRHLASRIEVGKSYTLSIKEAENGVS